MPPSSTSAPLTVSNVTANATKTYDGTILATLNTGSATLVGVMSGDTITAVNLNAYATLQRQLRFRQRRHVASASPVSGLGLGGTADAANYTLTQPTGLSADITPAALTVSGVSANTKSYDGTTTATLTTSSATLSGVVSGDTVSLNASSSTATFASANVGTGINVTVSGLGLSGARCRQLHADAAQRPQRRHHPGGADHHRQECLDDLRRRDHPARHHRVQLLPA